LQACERFRIVSIGGVRFPADFMPISLNSS